jgi:hypothetical protein
LASGGRLGEPDTSILYGNDRLETRHNDRFVGTRITLDWMNAGQTLGLEGRGFFLERDSTYFKATSDGSTLLARPFFTPEGISASAVIAGPTALGPAAGGFVGYSRVELFGEEANVVLPLATGAMFRWDLLVGSRFLQMRDRLFLTATGHPLLDPNILFGLGDQFEVHDAFYGAQVGLRGQYTWGNWYVDARGTIALGGDDQQIRTAGAITFQTPSQRTVVPYGLAVRPSNLGTFERGELDLVTEVAINAGYRLTRHVSLFAGYTFLYWNNPIRAGDQVDLVVNANQTGSPSRPAVPFKTDAFWAQGVNVGLDLHW